VRRTLFAAVVCALLVPATALAGGWATAVISAPPPAGLPAGSPWDVDVTIMQHGVTPLTGITPAVVVHLPGGGEKRFTATGTAKPGVYRAKVVFPKAGSYRYTVDDGFTNALPHEFPPVRIGAAAASAPAPAGPDDGGGMPLWAFVLAGLVLLAAAGAGLWLRAGGPIPAGPRPAGARALRAAASSAARRRARAAARGRNG
jgi:hypothetical protein